MDTTQTQFDVKTATRWHPKAVAVCEMQRARVHQRAGRGSEAMEDALTALRRALDSGSPSLVWTVSCYLAELTEAGQ